MANKPTQNIYEVGFHIIPVLSDEEAVEMYAGIRAKIAEKGEVLGEDVPERIPLAYTIRHNVRRSDGSYARYDEAYFCSVKCRVPQEFAGTLRQDLGGNEHVLRFLITETVADDTRVGFVPPGSEEKTDSSAESGEGSGTGTEITKEA